MSKKKSAHDRLEEDLDDPKCLKVGIGKYCDTSLLYHVGIVLELYRKNSKGELKSWHTYSVDMGPAERTWYSSSSCQGGTQVFDYNRSDSEVVRDEMLCTLTKEEFKKGKYLKKWLKYTERHPSYNVATNNCRDFTSDAFKYLYEDGYVSKNAYTSVFAPNPNYEQDVWENYGCADD